MSVTFFSLLTLFFLLGPVGAHADSLTVDSPPNGATVTGADNISGWTCDAESIQVRFDGELTLDVPYGGTRGDTATACGDADNGFTLAWNWNLFMPGQHTIEILRNGEVCDTRVVNVINLGTEFLTGAAGRFTLNNFPTTGQSVDVEWREDKQNFTIVEFTDVDICAGSSTFTCTCTGIVPGGGCGNCGAGGDSGQVREDVSCEAALDICLYADGPCNRGSGGCDGSQIFEHGWTCVENQ